MLRCERESREGGRGRGRGRAAGPMRQLLDAPRCSPPTPPQPQPQPHSRNEKMPVPINIVIFKNSADHHPTSYPSGLCVSTGAPYASWYVAPPPFSPVSPTNWSLPSM
jgi:hypothetical protein